ncbi:C4-dicarboxylate transport transcriptional regulatory protein (response regulator in two-component reguatory system) [Bradyrhizobium sp. ORS 278]|uniref:sigma-54-dependent transcriptional regulator n=1 Tax=Bradyrhizobium sp. (strain ORS 278) TaxID=114615 RepID=UPI0001507F20|nr:sigma-54 dependent transcriptional regulator [Bradyrhizobium sp. ORS 278]CAL76136.1 C4-dicarboxylate transport transcriptional regulatory protein (response regulator in two-component reguatory system) [Bradyrhizobium sp. ORS 278]
MSSEQPIGVIYVEDDEDVRIGAVQALQLAGFAVTPFASVEAASAVVRADMPFVVVSDVQLRGKSGTAWLSELHRLDPDLPVILVTGHGDISMAVEAMRHGAYDFIEKPCSSEQLVSVVRRALDKRRLTLEVRTLRSALADRQGIEASLLGRSPQIQEVRRIVANLASTNVDVTIYGETGTGKDVVARCLHAHSARRGGNYVAVNCGGLPESLVESELFGHEAGAFTGATKQRIGKIEYAHGGTLFLDEIESMPLSVQVKLLRALQDRAIERVGSNKPVAVECRVVAASKANLYELSESRQFRADLYYRLGVAFIELPPLRERREDIPILFEHFTLDAAKRFERDAPIVDDATMSLLLGYAWPGNVRELRNVADRFVLGVLDRRVLSRSASPSSELSLPRQLENVERSIIEDALRRKLGDVPATAAMLGVPKQTLYDKIKRLAIDVDGIRERH